ncbi:MAG: hypothetical protein A2516_05430 [Alphaproteobacteria bacterium RIFOXYD12_FULL_60_8]|nr:MAG: hypothetical protein A2516_05430 [Alphaproteobacteria bacterium RIFOXYD12_FULL_60_8]
MISRSLFLAVCLAALAPMQASAQNPSPRGAKKLAIVQIGAMIVPSELKRTRDGFAMVTPLVEIKLGVPVTEVCMYSSRVREVILLTLHSNPVTAIKDSEVVLPVEVGRQMLERVNQSVGGGNKIAKIHLLDGAMTIGQGVAAKLPYATVAGCTEFKKMLEEGKIDATGGENTDTPLPEGEAPPAKKSGH